jgi:hypothetical protein
MFPIRESQKKPDRTSEMTNGSYESLDQFATWLDNDLEKLVSKYAEFETDKSVRKFFKRS